MCERISDITALLLIMIASQFLFSQTPPENYTREWGTYFGGDDLDWGIIDVKVDNNGNSWVAGMVNTEATTAAFDELVTSDAYQETGAGGRDIFIVKFSPNGDLVYATYFGGEGSETFYSLDVKDDKLYISGVTQSETGIATPGSYQENLLQNTDPNGNPYDYFNRAAFIAQFDTLGELQWSTYYQGDRIMSSDAWGNIKAGNDDDVYLWTQSSSSDLGTSGAFKETIPSPYMNSSGELVAPHYPVLVRFDDDGQLLWSTYYGPDITTDSENNVTIPDGGLAIDSQNNVYVCGRTSNMNYYGTTGVHQPTNGGQNDIFFSKFSPTGQRIWSTYYGGTGSELVPKIHISPYDSFFLVGVTTSNNAITTPGTYQDTFVSLSNSNFVAKFSLNGQRLWGTYYNDTSLIFTAIDEDQYGNVFLCNVAGISDNLATEGSWQESIEGNTDNFILKLNPLGTNLEWGTYYGGDEKELNGKSLIVTDNDEIIMLGSSRSDYNIASEDAFQTSLIGTENLFLTKFIPCPEPEEPIATATQEFQPNQGKTLTDLVVEIPEWSGSEPIVIWYADEDSEEEIPETTELEDGETYYISRRIQGCDESDLVAITTEACQQPEPPTGTSPQGFDNGDTLAELDIEGENLRWYTDEERTEELPESTELQDGTTYYVSQTVADCESELISISVDEDLSVSVENFQQVKLFPNPNNGDFQLTGLPAEAIELTIYDIHGKILYTESLNKTRTSQSIVLNDQLSVGVYFVSLHSEQQYQNFKIVVE